MLRNWSADFVVEKVLCRGDSSVPAMVECGGPRFQAAGPQTVEMHFSCSLEAGRP